MSAMRVNCSVTWLDLGVAAEAAIYRAAWNASAYRRPHDHPDFLAFMSPAGYSPAAVKFTYGEARIVYPFFWCDLSTLPAFSCMCKGTSHLVSPYGYGGALYEGPTELKAEASEIFEESFKRELSSRGVVSEFIREDIFPERLACRASGERRLQQDNVVVRLCRDRNEIWNGYKAKVRKNVARARECGLRVEFDRDGRYLNGFVEVYDETMKRTSASESFLIPKEKFARLTQSLGRDMGLMYAHVFDGDRIISTELLLLSADSIYSFLGGTRDSAFEKRPNDLLKHEVISWGAEHGYKWYVLGGGVAPGDGIFKYKESFDPGGLCPFHVRNIIHDQMKYSALVNSRRNYERASGKDWEPRLGFFPEYLS